MKLCTLGRDFHVTVASLDSVKSHPGNRRASGFLSILPHVRSYGFLGSILWYDDSLVRLGESACWIQANTWLNAGNRIEDWLPDVDTNFHFEMNLPRRSLFQDRVVLYTSSVATNSAWHGWDPGEWVQLIQMIHETNPELKFLFVGASWDTDLTNLTYSSLQLVSPHIAKNADIMLSLPLREVLACIRDARLLIGFPSGLPILSHFLATPTFMFYPAHLDKLRYAFHNPLLESIYKTAVYESPESDVENVYEAIKEFL